MNAPTKSELAKSIRNKLKIRVLTVEYETILDLYEHGSATAGELLIGSQAAATTFYMALKSLETGGLISAERDTQDLRRKRYSLNQWARQALNDEYRFLPRWIDAKLDQQSSNDDGLQGFVRRSWDRLKVRFFSCEFQIILTIFEFGTCSAGELCRLCDNSNTTFYTALKRLAANRLIQAEQVASDHRLKRYHLPEPVRIEIEALLRDLRNWAVTTLPLADDVYENEVTQ